MSSRVRTRSSVTHQLTGGYQFVEYPIWWNEAFSSHERTVDELRDRNFGARRQLERMLRDNPDPVRQRQFDALTDDDWGGFFLSQKVYCEGSPTVVDIIRPTGGLSYFQSGHWLPDLPSCFSCGTGDFLPPSTDGELFPVGGTAISRCRPLESPSQLGVALGELRSDGLPGLPGAAIRRSVGSRSVAEEYLNYTFGIKPALSDLNDAVNTFKRADALWRQVERDAGRRIRRHYSFPTQLSQTVWSGSHAGWPTFMGLITQSGAATRTTTTYSRVWFSGAFKYALPDVNNRWQHYRSEADRWSKLYGLRPDPQVLWNLAPWTWLSDWFVDLQPLMGWFSARLFDGLVMTYGYLMEHKNVRIDYSVRNVTLWDGRKVETHLSRVQDTKKRVGANPYGFGVSWGDLTSSQVAILAALGRTRVAF